MKAEFIQIFKKIRGKIDTKPIRFSKMFIIAALIFGILYSVILTPNTVFDEDRHYASAYRYANVMLFQDFSLDNGNFRIRAEDQKVFDYSYFYGKEMLGKVKDNFFAPPLETTYVECDYDYYGNFLQYIPQSVGIAIGRIFHLGHLPVFYLGRLCNLLAYIGLVVIAIQKIPFGKMVMVLLGMLPIGLHQAASYNYDGVLNGVAFAFIAYVFYMAYSKEPIQWKDIVMTCLFSAMLGAYKGGVYLPLCGLLFLIPSGRFQSKKKWLGTMAVVAFSFVSMVLLLNLGRIAGVVIEHGQVSVYDDAPLYTVSYFLENPIRYVEILIHSLVGDREYYFYSAFGGSLAGCVTVRTPNIYILEYIGLIILAALHQEKKDDYIKMVHKVWFLVVIASLVCITAFVFLVAWTPYGEELIHGMQGRYFVPILPLAFFLFSNRKIKYQINLDRSILVMACIAQCMVIACLYNQVLVSGDSVKEMYYHLIYK